MQEASFWNWPKDQFRAEIYEIKGDNRYREDRHEGRKSCSLPYCCKEHRSSC